MVKEIGLAVAGVFLLGSLGCMPYSGGIRMHRTYYPRQGSSYGVVRNSSGKVIRRTGSVWGTIPSRSSYRIGLPRHATPSNIRAKFRRDVNHLRRHRR